MSLAALAVLASAVLAAPPARGGVFVDATRVTSTFDAPETSLTGKGFEAWQIDVLTDNGDLITAVDVSLLGAFHQRWYDLDFDAVPDPTPLGAPSDGRGDSHLTPTAEARFGTAPEENNNVWDSPLPDGAFDYGIGTYLRGAWGIPSPQRSDRVAAAYVVVPIGSDLVGDFAVATTGGTFEFRSVIPLCPEPSTLWLGAIGLVASAGLRIVRCGRRRRTSHRRQLT
ncbi:MAG: hypothetical protein KDA44_09465 [Planctomycetales bacterium]|nr:hypothetical protein [Planctomycetales bacterium]